MKKSLQKRTTQPKINTDLPVEPLTENECAQLAGGSYQSWAGRQGAWQATIDGTLNAI